MSKAAIAGCADDAVGQGGAAGPSVRAAEWLALAATPGFALMALLTAAGGDGAAEFLCAAPGGPRLGGMMPMYVLMSVFHAAPWVKLVVARGRIGSTLVRR